MGERFNLLTGKMIIDPPKKRKKKLPEAIVGDKVDAYLKSIGAYIRRINSTGTFRNGKWTTSQQGTGISDRLGILTCGRAIAVELKAEGKKRTVTESQIKFLIEYAKRGGVACVADCVEDVKKAIFSTKEEIINELNSLVKTQESINEEPLFP